MKNRFGKKAVKVSLNGGFTCPNIDGTKGNGGCIYCSAKGSGDFGGSPLNSIHEQFNSVKGILSKKWPESVFIAYFQANTNTYAPLPRLKELFEEALSLDEVVGLSISTRADCITEEIADYLADLSKRTFLEVELGLQTIHDKTAKYINRCHTYGDFLHGYKMLINRDINVCVHIINGLPYETYDMMMETAATVAKLHPHSVKIHLLHIIEGTALANDYHKDMFPAMSMDEYISIVCDQLEILPDDIIIQRLTGDGDRKTLIAPLWSLNKKAVMNGIDKELVHRNSIQGLKYKKAGQI